MGIIMASIITSIPKSLSTSGAQMQPAYSPDAVTSPTDYAKYIMKKR